MTERPILFSTPMVIAIDQQLKSMTRRAISSKYIINDDPDRYKYHGLNDKGEALFEDLNPEVTPWMAPIKCPYGIVGDLLWIRETFSTCLGPEGGFDTYLFKAGMLSDPKQYKWKPSIFMQKEIARYWLEITHIRVERLNDISPADACEEGIEYDNIDAEALNGGELVADFKNYTWKNKPSHKDYFFQTFASCIDSFRSLWESINGEESWKVNPWVWVVSFKITTKP